MLEYVRTREQDILDVLTCACVTSVPRNCLQSPERSACKSFSRLWIARSDDRQCSRTDLSLSVEIC